MPVCPKCNFDGRNEDQCERCGIIFDKMHTVLDIRPIDAIANPLSRVPPADAQEAPTQMESPKVVLSAARTFDPDATNIDVPMVPRVPERQTSSSAGAVLVVLVVIVGVWGAVQYRQSRVQAGAEAAVVENLKDAAFYDMAIEAMVADAEALRSITDPATARIGRERLQSQLAHLQQALETSLVPPVNRPLVAEVLKAMHDFIGQDVPADISRANLDRARAALAGSR